jgi:tetratricopeptide (TPR) repeat protein
LYFKSGMDDFKAAARNQSLKSVSLQWKARMYGLVNKFDSAVILYDAAIAEAPFVGWLYNNKGTLLVQKAKIDSGLAPNESFHAGSLICDCFEKAYELGEMEKAEGNLKLYCPQRFEKRQHTRSAQQVDPFSLINKAVDIRLSTIGKRRDLLERAGVKINLLTVEDFGRDKYYSAIDDLKKVQRRGITDSVQYYTLFYDCCIKIGWIEEAYKMIEEGHAAHPKNIGLGRRFANIRKQIN